MSTAATIPNEIELLRTANAELSQKAKDRKAKVTELEGKLATAEASLREYQIDRPLRRLAEDISTIPDIWEMLFSKHYKLEMREGTLTVLDSEGEPVKTADGSPVPFTSKALGDYVCSGDSEAAKQFARLTIVTRASGSGADGGKQGTNPMSVTTIGKPKEEPAVPLQQFGLR